MNLFFQNKNSSRQFIEQPQPRLVGRKGILPEMDEAQIHFFNSLSFIRFLREIFAILPSYTKVHEAQTKAGFFMKKSCKSKGNRPPNATLGDDGEVNDPLNKAFFLGIRGWGYP